MEERQVSVEGMPRPLPRPFLVAATQNPVEYEDLPPPEAQLDRFLLKVTMPLPSRDDEVEVVQRHAAGFDPRDLAARRFGGRWRGRPRGWGGSGAARRHLTGDRGLHRGHRPGHAQLAVPGARRQSARRDRTARDEPGVAWLNGRAFVTPDDVKAMAHATLAHRLTSGRRRSWRASAWRPSSTAHSVPSRCRGDQTGRWSRVVVTSRAVAGAPSGRPGVAPNGRHRAPLDARGRLAVAVDLALAPSPRGLVIERSGAAVVRLGESVTTDLVVTNPGSEPSAAGPRCVAAVSRCGECDRHGLSVRRTDPALHPPAPDPTRGPARRPRHRPGQRAHRTRGPAALLQRARHGARPAPVPLAPPPAEQASLGCARSMAGPWSAVVARARVRLAT